MLVILTIGDVPESYQRWRKLASIEGLFRKICKLKITINYYYGQYLLWGREYFKSFYLFEIGFKYLDKISSA